MFHPLALIPWFKLEAWRVPLPWIDVALPIQPFGILAALAIVVGSRVAQWHAAKSGVPRALVAEFVFQTVSVGLLSSMLLNVAFYEPEKFMESGAAIASWFSPGPSRPFPYPGLSSFGGFFGGTMAALWFRHRRRASLMVMADLLCFALPFAWLFARSGCFIVHDHPGLVSDFFLAVDDYNREGLPRHDLGLYEVIWSACMIASLLWLARKPRPWGFFTAVVTLAYAPIRFLLDFLRESAANGGDVRYAGLTPAQYAAVVTFAVGLGVAMRVARGAQPPLMLDRQAA